MKYLSCLTCFIISIISYQVDAQKSIEKQALELFDKYAPKIENSNEAVIAYRRAILGDLNNDDLTDAIVEFGMAAKGGNSVLFKHAAIYLNVNGSLKVVGGFEPAYCIQIESIKNGIVSVLELEACALPWPKTIALHYYKLEQNKLVETVKGEAE